MWVRLQQPEKESKTTMFDWVSSCSTQAHSSKRSTCSGASELSICRSHDLRQFFPALLLVNLLLFLMLMYNTMFSMKFHVITKLGCATLPNVSTAFCNYLELQICTSRLTTVYRQTLPFHNGRDCPDHKPFHLQALICNRSSLKSLVVFLTTHHKHYLI